MATTSKQNLLEQLNAGEIEPVFEALRAASNANPNAHLSKKMAQLSARWTKAQRDQMERLIPNADFTIERDKITGKLFSLIEELPDDFIVEIKPRSRFGFTSQNQMDLWRKIGYVAIIAGMLGGFADFFNFINLFPSAKDKALSITVFIRDMEGKPAVELQNKGRIAVQFGSEQRTPMIGENGLAHLGEVPAEFQGKDAEFQLLAEGWVLAEPHKKFKLNQAQIFLTAHRDPSLGAVRGIVQSLDGPAALEGAMVMIDHDTFVYTDNLGRFNLLLPEKKHKTSYLLTVKKDGFKEVNQLYRPQSSNADIRLEKWSNPGKR